MSGQSVIDRLNAAKHSLAGQGLAKAVCKATTEEVMGPKRKHLDYLLQCTNEPNVSTPQMADLLIERTQSTNWIVVFKALITIHNIMNYGNEKFFQYLASNNCAVSLENFLDKNHVQGFDMSTYIRKYGKYVNEKVVSYRALAYDLCKVKKGKEDGLLRTMPADKMLKALSALQSQVDALLEFDATPSDLVNGVISAAFLLICKDLIRLFACYNDGIINLLEKYFGLNRKQCREALDIYKQFLLRMDKISAFLKGAEPWAKKQNAGIDKDEIPDLAKAPASLLETLEAHLATLEAKRKRSKPKASAAAAATSAAADAEAPTNGSTAADSTDGQAQSQQQQEPLKEDGTPSSSSARTAAAAKPAPSPKGDRPSKPKAKKKSSSSKPAKEAKAGIEPPAAATTQPSPKHSPPPRPPPVSKTPQTLSPLHSADQRQIASAAAAEDSSSLLLLLEPERATTKPSDDLLELTVDAAGHGGSSLVLLQASASIKPAASSSSKLAAEAVGAVGKADNTLKPTARSSSPARPSSNVDLLSALGDPAESLSVETLETAKGTAAVDSAVQQHDILAKLSLKPTPARATTVTADQQTTGFFLLDFDSSQADSSLDVATESKAAAAAATSSSSSSSAPQGSAASAVALDLLSLDPLDVGGVGIVAGGSQATTATAAAAAASTRAQPAATAAAVVGRSSSTAVAAALSSSQQSSASTATSAAPPATSADATSGTAGDLLELLLAPVAPAAAVTPAVPAVDDSLDINLLAPIAATTTSSSKVKSPEIDLLSLEPELDPLKSPSATALIATKKNGEFDKLAAVQPATPAAAASAAPAASMLAGKDIAKNQQPALNQAALDSGRPSPPPYSPRDPIEMAIMKNMNFNSVSPTKNASTVKQPLSSISKPTADVTKPAANALTPGVAGASLTGTAAPAGATKNHQASAGQDHHKASGAMSAEPAQQQQPQRKAAPEKPLIGTDLDTSLISLASNLTTSTGTQRQKSSFQWHPAADKKLTGGSAAGDAATSAKQPLSPTHATAAAAAGAATGAGSVGVVDRLTSAGDAKIQPQPKAANASQITKQPATSTAKSTAPAVPTAEKSTEPALDPFGSL